MVNKRRRLLTWLRRADFESYAYTINKLGLQDIYSHTVRRERKGHGLSEGSRAGWFGVCCVWWRAVSRERR